MTDYADPRRTSERLSDTERDLAVRQLVSARDEGRLRTDEFDQRSASARLAVTRGDLAPLFSDLPIPDAAPGPAYASSASAPPPRVAAPNEFDQARSGPSVRALGGPVGATIMAVIPFVAVALFFITGFGGGWAWAWLWFFLVPLGGIIIYGPGADYRRRDRR